MLKHCILFLSLLHIPPAHNLKSPETSAELTRTSEISSPETSLDGWYYEWWQKSLFFVANAQEVVLFCRYEYDQNPKWHQDWIQLCTVCNPCTILGTALPWGIQSSAKQFLAQSGNWHPLWTIHSCQSGFLEGKSLVFRMQALHSNWPQCQRGQMWWAWQPFKGVIRQL